jgi:hypothetical protein
LGLIPRWISAIVRLSSIEQRDRLWLKPNTKVKDFGMLDLHLQKLIEIDVKA